MSDITQTRIQVTEGTKAIIRNDLTAIYQKKLNSGFKRLLLTKGSKLFNYILLAVGAIIIFVGLYFSVDETSNKFSLPLYIVGGLIIVVATISVTWSYFIKESIRDMITQSELVSLYHKAAENNVKTLTVNNINDNFSMYPKAFTPVKHYNSSYHTEKVISGEYANKGFNLGTILEKIIENEGTKEERTVYNRYLYGTITIDKYDYATTIQPENFLNKMFQGHHIKLESAEFEKMFLLDYTDPIKLRKLLQPKVMAQMIDYGKLVPKLPSIFLDYTDVTIMIPYRNIMGPSSKTGALVDFKITGNVNDTLNNMIAAIERDLATVMQIINWIKILDLI